MKAKPSGISLSCAGPGSGWRPSLDDRNNDWTGPAALVVAGQIPGNEIEHPMAIAIVGGLVTSTLLNLFVVLAL